MRRMNDLCGNGPRFSVWKVCVRYKCMCKGGEGGWSVQGLLWVDALCSTASSSWGSALPPGHRHVPQTPTQVWQLRLSMAKMTVPGTESHPCLGWLWDARQVILYCWRQCHPENRELNFPPQYSPTPAKRSSGGLSIRLQNANRTCAQLPLTAAVTMNGLMSVKGSDSPYMCWKYVALLLLSSHLHWGSFKAAFASILQMSTEIIISTWNKWKWQRKWTKKGIYE